MAAVVVASGVQGKCAGEAGRKWQRAEGDVQRSVRVSGLGVVVVRVHAGVLRLRDVVAAPARDCAHRECIDNGSVTGGSRMGSNLLEGGEFSVGGSNVRSDAADVSDEGGEEEREEETRRLGREELEARVGRGLYVAGAAWDEGNMVHAMRRFGGQTIGWRFGDG